MTRKYWKANVRRTAQATHGLAVKDGIAQAVCLPCKRHPTEDFKHLGRYEFDGGEDGESGYIGKSNARLWGKSQNPTKHINL